MLCHASRRLYCPHPLTVVPARCLSLGSSPALLLTLGWCSLCIAAVIGDGVAVVGCAVVIGVLPGVGCTVVLLVETSLVLLKWKEKITQEWDRKVLPPSPATGLLFGPPYPPLWHRLAVALVAVAALVLSPWWRSFPSLLNLASP